VSSAEWSTALRAYGADVGGKPLHLVAHPQLLHLETGFNDQATSREPQVRPGPFLWWSRPWPDLAKGLKPDALLVLNCTYQQFPSFKTFHTIGSRPSGGDGDHAGGRAVDAMLPYGNYKSAEAKAFGWKVANWARDNADRLGVKYIIFDKKIWSVARNPEGWRPYSHYTGCSTDTCLHYDHVHISVIGNSAKSHLMLNSHR
jgi:hypothetical protein